MFEIIQIETPEHTLHVVVDPQDRLRVFDSEMHMHDYIVCRYGTTAPWESLTMRSKAPFGWFNVHSSMSEEALMDWILDEAKGADIITWLTSFFEHHAVQLNLKKDMAMFMYTLTQLHLKSILSSFGADRYNVAVFDHDGPEIELNRQLAAFNPEEVIQALEDLHYRIPRKRLEEYSVAIIYLDTRAPVHAVTQSAVMLLYRFHTEDPQELGLLVPVVRYGAHTDSLEETENTNTIPEKVLGVCGNYYQVADGVANHLHTWLTSALKTLIYEEGIEAE